jgi:hypothetical protein
MITDTLLIRSTSDLSAMPRDTIRANPPFTPTLVGGIGAPIWRAPLDDAIERAEDQLKQRYDDYDVEDFVSGVERVKSWKFGARATMAISPMAMSPAFAARALFSVSDRAETMRSYAPDFCARPDFFDILGRDDGKYVDKYGRLARLSRILPPEPSYIPSYFGSLVAARKTLNAMEDMKVCVSAEAHVFLRCGHNGCDSGCWRRYGQYQHSPAILSQTPNTYCIFAKRKRGTSVIARAIAVIDSQGRFAIGNVYPCSCSQTRDAFHAIFAIAIANLYHCPLFEDFAIADMQSGSPFMDKNPDCYLNGDWRSHPDISRVSMAEDITGADGASGEMCDDCGERDSSVSHDSDLDRSLCDSCRNEYTMDYHGCLIHNDNAVCLSNGEYADGEREIVLECAASGENFVVSYETLQRAARRYGV